MSEAQALQSRIDDLAVAWEWVLRLREDDASPEHLAEWLQWYEADPRHREAFEEMQAFWREAGQLAENPGDVAELLDSAPRAEGPASPMRMPARRHALAWMGASFAAAASIAAVIGLGLLPSRGPDSAFARKQELSDGSTVQLAAKSRIQVAFTSQERRLEMQSGEAYFSVSKDPARPFIVQVGDLQVRAVGTAFNIRRADSRTVVAVTEGAVAVRNGSEEIQAIAGQQLVFDSRSSEVHRAPVDAARALAWQEGRLEYLNEPLAAVIADINRYSAHPVVIADEAAGAILFSGTVFTGQTDAWIQALPRVFAVEVRPRGDSGRVLSSRD